MMNMDAITSAAEITRHMANRMGDATALVFKDRETTYKELDSRASKVANGLIQDGCKPDARVGFMGKNSDHFVDILFGTFKANTVMVGVNWRLAGPEVEYVLNDAKVETLFVGQDFMPLVESIKDNVPTLRTVIAIDGGHDDWPSFEAWRDQQPDTDPMLEAKGDADVIQLYTSGTTGHPKGVQLTNDNYMVLFNQAVEAGWADYNEGESNLVCMPFFHVAGVNIAMMGLAQGCRNFILEDVDPMEIVRLMEEENLNIAFMVPAVILFVMQVLAQKPDADISSVRKVIYGASPIAEDLLKSAQDRFGCEFIQVYGLTETTGGGTYLPPDAHDPARGKLRSCGLPYPGTEIRVIDDNGQECAQGAVGEIQIRSGYIMKGYWNRPEATAEAVDAEGWFKSGDAGYFDEEGFLYIHDRVKDMIVSGGENVYPAEVENALFSHPKLADVAVIGVPSEKWGEAVKAVVVVEAGEEVSAEDIIAFAKEKIAGYKVPKSVDFIAELPRNPSGKILRRELRDPYWEGHDRKVG